ncbi:MAG: ATP-binding protein [Microthrixaceae bacterium]|nr:ATP-binding protein [Microthrixaceae bacterium]
MRPGIALPRHRATTAHLCSAYPFAAEVGLGVQGVYLCSNLLTGGGGFAFDPFEAYAAGIVTNPNMLIAGEPGVGKSATTKTFIHRSVGVFGRWAAVADPKGEYRPLAESLGMTVIKLHPGGTSRINPLDPGPNPPSDPTEGVRRQADMLATLLGTVLRRDLSPVEDAVLSGAVQHLNRHGPGVPTLADVVALTVAPTPEMVPTTVDASDLARSVEAIPYALGKLLDRSMRGMFDGPTNVAIDWSGPGLVIDLSAVHHDSEALTLVLVATTAWLQNLMATPGGPRRLQVLDEAWALLGTERTSKYLQACWKLSRSYGVANLAIVHRLSDLRSQTDDGTAASKVSMGLLADTQTRVLFRQSTDQVAEAGALLGLTSTEAQLLPRLVKGRALWKVAGRSAVVAHTIGAHEKAMCDTDAAMIDQ